MGGNLTYSPEFLGRDLPDEISEPLYTAEEEAFQAYMLASVDDGYALSRKISAMIEEQAWHSPNFEDMLKQLQVDVHTLADEARKALRLAA